MCILVSVREHINHIFVSLSLTQYPETTLEFLTGIPHKLILWLNLTFFFSFYKSVQLFSC